MPKKKEPSLLNILNTKIAKKDRINLTRPRDEKGRFMSLLSPKAKQKFNEYKVFGDDPQKILDSLGKVNDTLNMYIDKYSSDIENQRQFQQSSKENRNLMIVKENQLVQHSIHGNDLLQELQNDQLNMIPLEREILKYSKIDSDTLRELLFEMKHLRMSMHPFTGKASFEGPSSKINQPHEGGNIVAGLLGYEGTRALEKIKGLQHRALEGEIIPPSRDVGFRPTGPRLESPVIEHEPLGRGHSYTIPPIHQIPSQSDVSGGGGSSLTSTLAAGGGGLAAGIAGRKIVGGAVSKGLGWGARLLGGAGRLGLGLLERGAALPLAALAGIFDPNALPGSGKIADNDLAMIEKNKELSAKGYDPYVIGGAPMLAANTTANVASTPMSLPSFAGNMNVGQGLTGTAFKGPTPLGMSGKAQRLGKNYTTSSPYTGPSEPINGKTFAEKAPGIMKNLMKDFGLTKDQAAGLVGNLGHESGGFNSLQEKHPIGNGPGGYGWAQWTGPRRQQYFEWAKEHKLDPASDAANYGFLKHELQTDYKGTIAALKNTKNRADATSSVERTYEGAGIVNMASRDRYADLAAGDYDKSQKATEVASKDTDALMQGVKLAQATQEAQNSKEKATAATNKPQQQAPQAPPQMASTQNSNSGAMGEAPSVRDDNPTFMRALLGDYQTA